MSVSPAPANRASALREARLSDISRLNAICKSCFDHSLLWSGDHAAARAWWQAMIEADFSEVWVLEDPETGSVLGFTALLMDEPAWHRAHAAVLMTRAQKALQFLRHPGRVFARMRYKAAQGVADLPQADLALPREDRLFVEHFAVAPEAQGRGIARQLVEVGRDRTRHHGRRGILYMVDRTNAPMQKLMVSEGLVVQRETPVQFAFAALVE